MLYQLGALPIQVAPFNAHEVSETGEADYAVKPVVGREPRWSSWAKAAMK